MKNTHNYYSYFTIKINTFSFSSTSNLLVYQTEHFFIGFILEPRGQSKLFENSAIFESGPFTLSIMKRLISIFIFNFNNSIKNYLNEGGQ